MTEETYSEIKKALSRGATAKDIAKVFGIGECTVSRVNTTNTLEEYVEKRNKWNIKYNDSKDEQEQIKGIDVNAFYYNTNRIYEELKKQTELLAKIAQQWE